jgi:hypothetical protein
MCFSQQPLHSGFGYLAIANQLPYIVDNIRDIPIGFLIKQWIKDISYIACVPSICEDISVHFAHTLKRKTEWYRVQDPLKG